MSSGAAALLPNSGDAAHDRYLHHLTRDAVSYSVERLLEGLLARTVPIAAPAAGAEIVQVVPAGVTWELVAMTYSLVTSATVSNRASRLEIRDADANVLGRFQPAAVHAASTTTRYTWFAGLGASSSTFDITSLLPTPPVSLTPGQSIRTATANLDATDQYSSAILLVTELYPGRILNSLRVILTDFDSTGMLDKLGGEEIYGAAV